MSTPVRFHSKSAGRCVHGERARREASDPFTQRMMAVATKTAKKTSASAMMIVQNDAQIADRGKPKPIDQEVGHEPQQDQAGHDNDESHEERTHAPSPRAPPDLDCHVLIQYRTYKITSQGQ